MNTIQLKQKHFKGAHRFTLGTIPKSLLKKYMDYVASKDGENMYWYLKVLIMIPCAMMVPSITAMYLLVPNFIWFIVITMLLFFLNMGVHIAQLKSTIFIPLYHATILIMTLIPFITYLLNL